MSDPTDLSKLAPVERDAIATWQKFDKAIDGLEDFTSRNPDLPDAAGTWGKTLANLFIMAGSEIY